MTNPTLRPAITLVEFEQIYDEYLYLCNDNQTQVNAEEISLSKLKASHFLTQEEKDAILNQNLSQYLEQLDRELFKNDEFEEVKDIIGKLPYTQQVQYLARQMHIADFVAANQQEFD